MDEFARCLQTCGNTSVPTYPGMLVPTCWGDEGMPGIRNELLRNLKNDLREKLPSGGGLVMCCLRDVLTTSRDIRRFPVEDEHI